MRAREMQNHDAPGSWAHDHSPRSYGSRAIKNGKAHVEQRAAEIV
jgi:hypothetical protein